jgi:hypothetical protein
MRRHHLDIECVIATVDVVLNALVWELDVALVVARQVVLPRPGPDLVDVPIGPSVAILPVAIPFLQELLILPLQLVVQEDAVDVCTLLA